MAEKNDFGREAETAVAYWLRARGYTVREQNWRPPASHKEVDIIAERDAMIAFVEVKARAADGPDPAEAVDMNKIRFLTRAADSYLRMQPRDYDCRFDIACVTRRPDGTLDIEHLPDAFIPPLS